MGLIFVVERDREELGKLANQNLARQKILAAGIVSVEESAIPSQMQFCVSYQVNLRSTQRFARRIASSLVQALGTATAEPEA